MQIIIKSGNTQIVHNFPHELRTEEIADLLSILAICLYEVELKDALIQLELLRQVPIFFESFTEEDIA